MLRSRSNYFVAVMAAVLVVTAGCSFNPFRDTKPSQPQTVVGLVDMEQAIKNHPKHANFEKLQNEYNALVAEVEAAKRQNASAAYMDGSAGLSAAASDEFNSRMTAKQSEMNTQLQAEVKEVEQKLGTDMESYVRELDKDYQPRIFSLQLKLKTLELSKEQAETLAAESDKLQKERSEKIASKHEELAKQLNETMAGKQAAAKAEFDSYGQRVHNEIGDKLKTKQAELANRNAVTLDPANGSRSEPEQKLALKQQEIKVLQEFIVNDIRDKVGVIAAKLGLEIVLTEAKVNISAVDITNQVITEINK
ncbi:MAG: outer rane chaperone Skp (OmpH) [Firmicutes bacterium]|nr:outer rane chaperone Skp (OmpH) [Bacillota bacterium]